MAFFLLLAVLTACDTNREADTPRIFEIEPTAMQVKSPVTIRGTKFIDTYSQTIVRFNGEKADRLDFISVTDDEIVVRVPREGSTGPVDIKISDKTSNSVDFTVLGPWAYVVFPDGFITAFDTYNNLPYETFPVDFTPDVVAFTPEGDKAYLISSDHAFVVVLNAPANEFLTAIPLFAPPVDIVVSTRKQHRAFVSHGPAGGVTVIDTLTDTVEFVLPVGSDPGSLAVDQDDKDTNRLLVANRGDRTVMSFEVENLERKGVSPVLSGTPAKLYISPNTSEAVSVNTDTNTVSLLRTRDVQLRGEVAVGENPVSGVFTTDNGAFYVVNRGSNTVSVVDISDKRVSHTVAVGLAPFEAVSRANKSDYIYVSNSGDGTVTVIHNTGRRDTITLPVGVDPRDMGAVRGPEDEQDKIFVLNRGSGTITIINADNRTVVGSVAVGPDPLFMKTEVLDTYPPKEDDIVRR